MDTGMIESVPLMIIIAVMFLTAFMLLWMSSLVDESVMDLEATDSWTDALLFAIILVFALMVISFFNIRVVDGAALVSVNLTGAVIPLSVCTFLLIGRKVGLRNAVIATAVTAMLAAPLTFISSSSVVIGFPEWLIPAGGAAACAYFLSKDKDLMGMAAVAYFGGTIGMLLGGDIMKISSVQLTSKMEFVIGANGVYDFVFLVGVVATVMIWGAIAVSELAKKNRLGFANRGPGL
jgi:uncharacterized membrane protein